ncbi:DUF5655 domain-containing protein [Chromobacterium violaceum]|uniref:Uncharacterized conserved protein n=1 Tax=Chromobacterium violaceum TaxID=536 RepID=A0AAX2MBG7_CHRVL|nr:DUF5655 domain-containing protein [Chromobacterium violaceum]OLZ75106.1 DUF91 domain-containing protein [Chromobacterium violaceum]STB64795.1 Uncharacterized conserved protein [Chromobacterium violaceum]SUX33722.1 Uncharacterized conserved protein [Chromobacterium violaceum]
MSTIQLFRCNGNQTVELAAYHAKRERQLQNLVEGQMETLLGVRFLASEYATGKTHRGRIDSLGLDENGCPVIIEYKRASKENVINQGLFYLDWLLDHKAEFNWLVMEKLGKQAVQDIEWKGTRLLCIASDFTRYDEHAVQQIPRNIELIRYRFFDLDLLLLERVNTVSEKALDVAPTDAADEPATPATAKAAKDKTHEEQLAQNSPEIRELYAALTTFILSLGEDVQERQLKLYTAFRRIKNFACVVALPKRLLVMLKLDPKQVALEDNFSRDVSEIGHWGTGDLELTLRAAEDLEKAKPLIERCYLES